MLSRLSAVKLPSNISSQPLTHARDICRFHLARRAQLLLVAAAVACVSGFFYSGGNSPASFFGLAGDGVGGGASAAATHTASSAAASRHILATGGGTCKPTEDWEKVGGLIGYFLGVFFMFLGIAIVCDDFFVASLVGGGVRWDRPCRL